MKMSSLINAVALLALAAASAGAQAKDATDAGWQPELRHADYRFVSEPSAQAQKLVNGKQVEATDSNWERLSIDNHPEMVPVSGQPEMLGGNGYYFGMRI